MWLCFVRHGQTEDNVQGIIQGHKDTPLNDHGRRESRRLAKRLKDIPFTEAYSSPLSRAKETAEIVLHYHPRLVLNLREQLKERCLGSMEGRRRGMGERAPADAESGDSMFARQEEWFNSLLATHEPPDPLSNSYSSFLPNFQRSQHKNDNNTDDENILICSHGAWLGSFLRLITSPPYKFTLERGVDPRRPCLNTSLMVVHCEWKNGRWKGAVCTWGDASHLEDMMQEEVVQVADDVR